ncbi:JmjC domain-containing protein 7 [Hypsizygus marmoreus]|uniref:JmjC domain-containing protein 7 n=1 Tax=Hypsizygus marmoreus TaxID=39966 RepID=A0A369JME4_HYPMA|nr:JmjC domain-containing protein 7 [Hypsizygus marmoreus]
MKPLVETSSIRWLSQKYYEQNGDHIEVLETPPSALHFSRLVHISRPVVIKGFQVPASNLWSDEYLIERMGTREISIAVTPNGLADAVTRGPDNRLYFAEPLVEQMTMEKFLSRLSPGSVVNDSEIHYLQSQNGNLYASGYFEGDLQPPSEFDPLRPDVPSDIPWCSEAFDRTPDAVNLWIGDSRSITSIHSDPYENIYTVVRGAKHFTLFPPTDGWSMDEHIYPHATYKRSAVTSALMLEPSSPTTEVRWSSISDPHIPGVLPPDVHPVYITLGPGDTLYLPAGWWHHVQQSEITIALNWWYDIEMQGMSWVLLSFLRGIGDVPPGNPESATATEDGKEDVKSLTRT